MAAFADRAQPLSRAARLAPALPCGRSAACAAAGGGPRRRRGRGGSPGDSFQFEVQGPAEGSREYLDPRLEDQMVRRYQELYRESGLRQELRARARFERPRDKGKREKRDLIQRRKWERDNRDWWAPEGLEGGADQLLDDPFAGFFAHKGPRDAGAEGADDETLAFETGAPGAGDVLWPVDVWGDAWQGGYMDGGQGAEWYQQAAAFGAQQDAGQAAGPAPDAGAPAHYGAPAPGGGAWLQPPAAAGAPAGSHAGAGGGQWMLQREYDAGWQQGEVWRQPQAAPQAARPEPSGAGAWLRAPPVEAPASSEAAGESAAAAAAEAEQEHAAPEPSPAAAFEQQPPAPPPSPLPAAQPGLHAAPGAAAAHYSADDEEPLIGEALLEVCVAGALEDAAQPWFEDLPAPGAAAELAAGAAAPAVPEAQALPHVGGAGAEEAAAEAGALGGGALSAFAQLDAEAAAAARDASASAAAAASAMLGIIDGGAPDALAAHHAGLGPAAAAEDDGIAGEASQEADQVDLRATISRLQAQLDGLRSLQQQMDASKAASDDRGTSGTGGGATGGPAPPRRGARGGRGTKATRR